MIQLEPRLRFLILFFLKPYHAAFSSELIIPDPQPTKNWVPAKFDNHHYIRNDKVCIDVCAKIEAYGKT
jgi:hypothetical protein